MRMGNNAKRSADEANMDLGGVIGPIRLADKIYNAKFSIGFTS